jgi:hypothetical protein
LRPDLSVQAILSRHNERELTPHEFEEHFGELIDSEDRHL